MTFGRDCGGTTGCSTNISILSDLAPLRNETGNAFEAWDDTGIASVGSWGGPIARLTWISNRKIAIRYDPRAETWNATRVTVEGIGTVDVLASPEDPRMTKIPARPSRLK